MNSTTIVTSTVTEKLMVVKSTNVSSCVKMNGDLNTVQKDIHLSIVNAQKIYNLKDVKVNGIVKISTISLPTS